MHASRFLITTLKEAPSDAEVTSHRLMMRAGLIRKVAAGIYTYMPMGLRVIRKIENIIREEMNRAGALELIMPMVQPAELWEETGRWTRMGEEMLRLKDRHDRDFALQPTSEEVVTDVARQTLRSYRQLPANLYQIQTKFRDERRPRFGIMRGREFTMKDAYSFDRTAEAAGESYEAMYTAYTRIFDRIGLQYRAVAADTGAIGGDRSHEFQVIADTGEDDIIYCAASDYAANIELATCLAPTASRPTADGAALTLTPTPGRKRCESVAELLGLPLTQTVKAIVLATDPNPENDQQDSRIWLLLVRGDHSLNEVKAGKLDGLKHGFRFATDAEIERSFGCEAGYIGPVGVTLDITVIADREVAVMGDFVCGANQSDHHFTHVHWGRDLPEPAQVADIRNVVAGDPSPDGAGPLAIQRGIEVGHVFYLGTKYSVAMNATFLDEDGKPKHFEMGCYGIGVTRIAGAAIEQNHDERGIRWPQAIAPFELVICPVGMNRSEAVRDLAESLHRQLLAAGVDVVLDDRNERPGAMFADWELIGVPWRVTIGDRGLKEGIVEVQRRDADTAERLALDELAHGLLVRLGYR